MFFPVGVRPRNSITKSAMIPLHLRDPARGGRETGPATPSMSPKKAPSGAHIQWGRLSPLQTEYSKPRASGGLSRRILSDGAEASAYCTSNHKILNLNDLTARTAWLALYRASDAGSGDGWRECDHLRSQRDYALSLAIDPQPPDAIYAGTYITGVFKAPMEALTGLGATLHGFRSQRRTKQMRAFFQTSGVDLAPSRLSSSICALLFSGIPASLFPLFHLQ